jgi:quercetin dioxygenase-like cupin family protein
MAEKKDAKGKAKRSAEKPLIVKPGEGRRYPMGKMQAVFKADCEETGGRFSVSEWWLEPGMHGPGSHFHDEDHVFIIIEGRLNLYLDGQWHECEKGSYAIIPGGTPHDFENLSDNRAGFISLNVPGNFEKEIPAIAEWFEQQADTSE